MYLMFHFSIFYFIELNRVFKGTLMQIWKSHHMFGFIQKQYPESFAFLILRIPELFTREVRSFPKK